MSKFQAQISVALNPASVEGLAKSVQAALSNKTIALDGLKITAGNIDVSGIVNSIKQKIQSDLKNIDISANISGGNINLSGASGGSSKSESKSKSGLSNRASTSSSTATSSSLLTDEQRKLVETQTALNVLKKTIEANKKALSGSDLTKRQRQDLESTIQNQENRLVETTKELAELNKIAEKSSTRIHDAITESTGKNTLSKKQATQKVTNLENSISKTINEINDLTKKKDDIAKSIDAAKASGNDSLLETYKQQKTSIAQQIKKNKDLVSGWQEEQRSLLEQYNIKGNFSSNSSASSTKTGASKTAVPSWREAQAERERAAYQKYKQVESITELESLKSQRKALQEAADINEARTKQYQQELDTLKKQGKAYSKEAKDITGFMESAQNARSNQLQRVESIDKQISELSSQAQQQASTTTDVAKTKRTLASSASSSSKKLKTTTKQTSAEAQEQGKNLAEAAIDHIEKSSKSSQASKSGKSSADSERQSKETRDYQKLASDYLTKIYNQQNKNSAFLNEDDVKKLNEFVPKLEQIKNKGTGNGIDWLAKSDEAELKRALSKSKADTAKLRLENITETQYESLHKDYERLKKSKYYAKNKQRIDEEIGEINPNMSKADYDAAIGSVAKFNAEAEKANQTGKSFLSTLQDQFNTYLKYTIVAEAFMKIRQVMQEMVTAVKEVDAAMTELKKVTDLSDSGYTQALEQAKTTAKEVGATVSDTVNATADFARLGYDVDDAAELAKVALVYKNVGDGIEDVSQASESIISTMKAFGIEAKDAMSIVDKFNEVGNNFAISSTGIGTALQKSAAALAVGGNTIDESIALVTAANSVVQNPEVVGTALKTYSMYLRAAKIEAEEAGEETDGMAVSVSKLRDDILTLTGGRVDTMADALNPKSMYQFTKELAAIWDTIPSIDQAAILEKIGGKRNANTLASLITNFAEAEKALETSLNSSGSAMAENEKYLDSIAGKTAQLKAAFEDLSTSFLSSDIFKFFIDLGKGAIEVLDSLIDKIGGVATAIGSVVLASTVLKISSAVKDLGGLSETIKALGATSGIKDAFASLGLTSSFVIPAAAIAGTAAVIGAVSQAIKNYREEFEKQRADAEKSAIAYEQNVASAEEYKNKIIEIRTELESGLLSTDMAQSKRMELVEIESQLVEMFGNEAAALDLITGSVDDQIKAIDVLKGKSFDSWVAENAVGINAAKALFSDLDSLDWKQKDFGDISKYYVAGNFALDDLYLDKSSDKIDSYSFVRLVENEFKTRYRKSLSRGQGGISPGYYVEANTISEMREYASGMIDIISDLGKKYFGSSYTDYLETALSDYGKVLGDIDNIIGKHQQNFDTYAKGRLESDYADYYSKLLTARKEYDDAVLSGDDAAIESAYRVMKKQKSAIDGLEIDDIAVKTWLDDYFKDFENQEIEIGAKIDIRKDLSKDRSHLKESLENSLGYFLDEEKRLDEAALKLGKLKFDNGDISNQAKAYGVLTSAAQHYGLEVEQLISILTQLGVVHESALTEAHKNASTDFADITNSLKRSFIEIGESGTGDFSGVTDDVERLKLVFYELADAYGYGSDELQKNIDNAGSFADFVSSAYSTIESQAESVATAMETVNAAMEEQAAAGTVSLETFEKLAELGDAYTNVLEWNGQGLAVNREAVENLNEALREGTRLEAESMQAASIDAWKNNIAVIAQMSASYSTLSESRKADLDSLIQYNAELLKSINGFQILMSQMDFENSGYKKWLDSANQTDTDKMYSDAVNAYQATQQVFGYTDKSSGKWVAGNRKINSLSFNAATEFLVPENIRKQGIDATQKYLNGIKKYMQDDQKSVEEFLKDAKLAGLMDEENGVWSVNAGKTTEDFTKDLKITKDLLTSLVGDANVYGVQFKFDDENQILALNDMQDYYETLNEYNKANADYNDKYKHTLEGSGKVVEEQTEEAKAAKKKVDELNVQLADKEKELSEYDEETLKNLGVKFEEGQTKEEAIKNYLKGPDAELEVDVQYVEKNPKVGIQQKIQEYREAYAAMANDPNNLEAINKVEQLGTELSNLPTEVKTAFNIDTSLFEYGIASISETINDLVGAGKEYQLNINEGKSTEETEAKIKEITDSLNKLPEEKLVEIGFTTENGLLNEDGTINTDNLLKGLGDGTITLDSFNLDFSNTDTSGIEGTLQTLEQIQAKVEEIRNAGDLVVFVDMFIDEALAKIGDIKIAIDAIKNIKAMATITLSAPNVLFLVGEIGRAIEEITQSEHNATITATVIQAAMALAGIIGQLKQIEGDHSLTVSASTSQAISAINGVKSALGELRDKTVTVTVNTVNKSTTQVNGSTTHSSGSGTTHGGGGGSFAGGSWGVKRGGVSLVGELGREIVVDPDTGTWHTVGDYGAEFTNIPTGAIVFNHKQTEALLKYGKVAGRGKALAEGTAMLTASGGLWKPSSSGGSTKSYSYDSSDVDVVAEAVKEGTKEGVEEGFSETDDKEHEDIYELMKLVESRKEYDAQFTKEQNMLAENNAVNEKLVDYLLEHNFGFTEEELQEIIDGANERYGDYYNKLEEDKPAYYKAMESLTSKNVLVTGPTGSNNSYAMRMMRFNGAVSTLDDGNIEQFGFDLKDSAYTKETIRNIIEKFFESIATGPSDNFKSVDDLKQAIANALYSPDMLLRSINDKKEKQNTADRIVSQNNMTGDRAIALYKERLGEYYDSDNTDLWADKLTEKLDELFSGDWYEKLTTEKYRSYTTSDVLSSGVEDLIEIFFDRLERRIDKIDKIVSSSFKDISTRSAASYDKIDLLAKKLADKQKAADIYKEAAEVINLSDDIKKALRDGALRIEELTGTMSIDQSGAFTTTLVNANLGSTTGTVVSMSSPGKDTDAESAFKENVSKYQDYYGKYLDTLDDIDEIQDNIAEAYKEKFDNIQTDYDNQLALLDHEATMYTTVLDQMQDMGYAADTGYYDILKGVEQERYDMLVKKYDTLHKEYDEAMASGAIDYGSEAWYELIAAINETEEAMQNINTKMIEYTNKARELIWDVFDSRQDRIGVLIDQNEFLMDLIDDSNIFDKDGKITQKGFAYMAVGMNNLRKNIELAKNYGAELQNISEQLSEDQNNKILLEREQDLREKQQSAILAAKKSADAINDIELKSLKNLIDNYENAISKQKDTRDYQRKVRDQTDSISDIRKQIEVYSNDTSEEATRKVQELQKKLRDAEENLEDTQYDRYISMQKEMFDELYDEYEETLNRRFDDIDKMISDVSGILSDKVMEIAGTLQTIARGVGYIIQDGFDNDKIGDIDLNGLITPEDARLAMRASVGLEKLTEEQIRNGDMNGSGSIDPADARAIMRIATKIDTIEQYLIALGIVGYKGGGLVSKTGLAMLHGTSSDPEVVLDANDSKNLIALRDTMRNMARMDLYPLGITQRRTATEGVAAPTIGEIQINIPIDKVEDYNDFIEKMKTDSRFGKMVRAASVDLLNGGSAMKMYQI